jgi:hypothetical protein
MFCYILKGIGQRAIQDQLTKWSFQLIKRRVLTFTFITIVIILNTSFVYYASETRIQLPQPVSRLVELFSSYFDAELTESPPNKKKAEQTNNNNERNQSQLTQSIKEIPHNTQVNKLITATSNRTRKELKIVGSNCSNVNTITKSRNIYKWVDEAGITNLSDKPRSIDSKSPVEIVGTIIPEFLSINYINNEGSIELKNKINASVINAKQFFERVVPKSLVKPVKINFRLFSDSGSYDNYRNKVAPTVGPSSGFYSSKHNESVVMMFSEKQGIETSIHEAMHSINRHWFGNMSRWLNEGIAEYAEIGDTNFRNSQTSDNRIKFNMLVPLSTLFQAEEIEWRRNQEAMYATSFAFIAFLMTEQPVLLSRMLLAENLNGCQTLKLQDVERISGSQLRHLQNKFNIWLGARTTF